MSNEIVCIKDDGYSQEHIQWIDNFPIKNNIYTIRARIHSTNGLGYLLNEIRNEIMPNGKEPNFSAKRFAPLETINNINEITVKQYESETI